MDLTPGPERNRAEPRRTVTAALASPAVPGAVLTAIAVALPWASVVGAAGQHAELRGVETDDGPVVLVLALVAAVIAVQPRLQVGPSSRSRRVVVAALGLGAALVAGLQLLDLREAMQDLETDPTVASAEVGVGVSLALLGGALIVLGSVVEGALSPAGRSRRRRAGAEPPEGPTVGSAGPAPR